MSKPSGEIQKDCETEPLLGQGGAIKVRAEETMVPSSANLERVLDEPSGGCGKCDVVEGDIPA